ncbi:MAG: hypothetical protein ACYSR0_11080 [Planctomycetota bacterium]
MSLSSIPSATRIKDNDGDVAGVSVNPRGVGFLDIHDADFHESLINEHFHQHQGNTTNISSAANGGDISISINTTGYSPLDFLQINSSDSTTTESNFPQIASVSSGAPGNLFLTRPIDNDYTTGATVEIVSLNMATSGASSAPNRFEVQPPSGEVWHIARVLISITTSGGQPDDGKFGSIAGGVSNGVVIRENKNSTTTFKTLSTWKTNASLVEDMYDVDYREQAGAIGIWGVRGRWTFKKSDAIIRLDGSNNDKLEILIQDSTTALTSFSMKAQGHKEE